MLFLCDARLSPSWRWQTAPVQIASTDNPSGNCLCEFQRCSLWQKPLYKSLFRLEFLFKHVWAVMVCCVMIGVGSSAGWGGHFRPTLLTSCVQSGRALGMEAGLGWLPFSATLCVTFLWSYSILTFFFFQIPYLSICKTRGVGVRAMGLSTLTSWFLSYTYPCGYRSFT